jgi:hypothetical protein
MFDFATNKKITKPLPPHLDFYFTLYISIITYIGTNRQISLQTLLFQKSPILSP